MGRILAADRIVRDRNQVRGVLAVGAGRRGRAVRISAQEQYSGVARHVGDRVAIDGRLRDARDRRGRTEAHTRMPEPSDFVMSVLLVIELREIVRFVIVPSKL